MEKSLSEIPYKIFPTQFFYTEHLKQNTKPKTKQVVEHPRQILDYYVHIGWGALRLLRRFFKAFRISWFFWPSIFDHFQILLIWYFNYFYVRAM